MSEKNHDLKQPRSIYLFYVFISLTGILIVFSFFYFPNYMSLDLNNLSYFIASIFLLAGLIVLGVIQTIKIHQYNMKLLDWYIHKGKDELESVRQKEQRKYNEKLRANDLAQQQFNNYLRIVEMSMIKTKIINQENTKTANDSTTTTRKGINEQEQVDKEVLNLLMKNKPKIYKE